MESTVLDSVVVVVLDPLLFILVYATLVEVFVYQGVNKFCFIVDIREGFVTAGDVVVVVVVGSYEYTLHLGKLSIIISLRTIPVSGFGEGTHGFGSFSNDLRLWFALL